MVKFMVFMTLFYNNWLLVLRNRIHISQPDEARTSTIMVSRTKSVTYINACGFSIAFIDS
jgi:hypothetical protein